MSFDRFDICEAYHVFATYWHRGQWSEEYAIFGRLSKLQFRPAPNLDINTLTHNGRMILKGLIRKQLQDINTRAPLERSVTRTRENATGQTADHREPGC